MTKQIQAISVTDNLQLIHHRLVKLLDDKSPALPVDFNKTRFLQNTMTVLEEVKGIERMDANSVTRVLLQGAFLGLDFFNGECYAIPYGAKLRFQTDYKGEIKLAKKYAINPVKEIYAKVVREGDVFEEVIQNGYQTLNFKPIPFSNEKLIGAFAVVRYTDGTMIYETMSAEQIIAVRTEYSKQPNGKAWRVTPEEMYKKTVIRRLCKLIELEFETLEQNQAFKDSLSDKVYEDDIVIEQQDKTSLEEEFEATVNKCDDDIEVGEEK